MRILVADDHALVREGLVHTLSELDPAAEIIEADSAEAVYAVLAGGATFDLALLDLFMPGVEGFDLLTTVCDRMPDLPVVVLSASEDSSHVRKAIDCGASGYVPKSSGRDVMLSALRLVLAGGVYLPPTTLAGGAEGAPAPVAAHLLLGSLTPRQREVLRLLGAGLSNKEIARQLGLSENTIKIHVTAILRSLQVSNRTAAVVLARESQ
jgi:DNA-binding NarL/FixJ family response regulator